MNGTKSLPTLHLTDYQCLEYKKNNNKKSPKTKKANKPIKRIKHVRREFSKKKRKKITCKFMKNIKNIQCSCHYENIAKNYYEFSSYPNESGEKGLQL